jgi:hypothetical protein
MGPRGALDQLGRALSQIIHAFAKADDNDKILMAKWDIKGGFWCMDCEAGEEYNFAYVLPQEEGMPITLVVPTLLQMGWVESPPYFCVATETASNIAPDYCNTPARSLSHHTFAKHVTGTTEFNALDNWRRLQILESLAKVCGTCGSGPLPSGYQLPKADQTTIRVCSTSPNRLLW